jgi:hypothetical protein
MLTNVVQTPVWDCPHAHKKCCGLLAILRASVCRLSAAEIWRLCNGRFQDIREGEPVELLVVATQPSFGDFKALKEAYLPESSLWVADYPYVDRDAFLDISLEIERARADSQPPVYSNGSPRMSNTAAFRP